ncbi:MAG TPA: helix-turn-helix domain-containing protein [bacterium]|nr:helix-turn-helix domain-containing protein [bacterium]
MSNTGKSYKNGRKNQVKKSIEPKNDALSTGDAAKLLRVSRNTVRRWVKEGVLDGYRINEQRGHYRFSRQYILSKASALFPNDFQN